VGVTVACITSPCSTRHDSQSLQLLAALSAPSAVQLFTMLEVPVSTMSAVHTVLAGVESVTCALLQMQQPLLLLPEQHKLAYAASSAESDRPGSSSATRQPAHTQLRTAVSRFG
jgi:hypothetical protein